MFRKKPDPIAIEAEMITKGVLPPHELGPRELGDLESLFTERNPRKTALWRISMVRQFHPNTLKGLSKHDLLYLAGQSPEGYPANGEQGIELNRNKIIQNAQRAKIELERRMAWAAWWRLAASGLVVGAMSALIGAFLR